MDAAACAQPPEVLRLGPRRDAVPVGRRVRPPRELEGAHPDRGHQTSGKATEGRMRREAEEQEEEGSGGERITM